MKNWILSIATLFVASISLSAQSTIAPNDANIHIHGAKFVKMENGVLVMHRHSDKLYEGTIPVLRFNPEKAKSSTGISIRFKTSSPNVKVNLKISDDVFKKKPSGGYVGIYQHVNSIAEAKHTSPVEPISPNQKFNIGYKKGKAFTINIKSENVGKVVEYKITLPIFLDINLVSLELDKGYELVKYKEKSKPIYVAYGNSITHGRGQQGTDQTYAYLISEWNNWELYNLAVGGGKTSPVMAKMIADKFNQIDYMTVLIGYNDLAGGGESPETFTKNYTKFLKTIRAKHPDTKIFCITLTDTKLVTSQKSDHTPEEFRQVIRKVVSERIKKGDKKIYLIEGTDISKKEWLADKVHFTPEGILNVADKLYYEIEKNK